MATHHENDFCREQTAHGVADEDDIGGGGLVRLEPGAEVVASNLDGMVGLVAGVDLGVDDVGFGEQSAHEGVDVGGKGLEGLVVAVEAVDVDEEQLAARVREGDMGGCEGLGGRGAWIG